MIDEKKLIEDIIKVTIDTASELKVSEILNIIYDQPKVGSWIPCSERLPEMHREDMESEGEYYMISDPVLATDGDNMYVAEYEIDDGCRAGWVDCVGEDCEDIIAWQPLPEPYRPGGVNHEE